MKGTNIHIDETYYPIMEKDTEKRPDGKGMRGLSRNKRCIGCAWDGINLVRIMEGYGKPSKKHTWESFSSHIKEGSKLIRDGDNLHSILFDNLDLSEEVHTTKETKGLKDKENRWIQKMAACDAEEVPQGTPWIQSG